MLIPKTTTQNCGEGCVAFSGLDLASASQLVATEWRRRSRNLVRIFLKGSAIRYIDFGDDVSSRRLQRRRTRNFSTILAAEFSDEMTLPDDVELSERGKHRFPVCDKARLFLHATERLQKNAECRQSHDEIGADPKVIQRNDSKKTPSIERSEIAPGCPGIQENTSDQKSG